MLPNVDIKFIYLCYKNDKKNDNRICLFSFISSCCFQTHTSRQSLKGSIFLKNRQFFFIQERFNKLMYGINTIIKCDIGQP